jgi:hypothetical protein
MTSIPSGDLLRLASLVTMLKVQPWLYVGKQGSKMGCARLKFGWFWVDQKVDGRSKTRRTNFASFKDLIWFNECCVGDDEVDDGS